MSRPPSAAVGLAPLGALALGCLVTAGGCDPSGSPQPGFQGLLGNAHRLDSIDDVAGYVVMPGDPGEAVVARAPDLVDPEDLEQVIRAWADAWFSDELITFRFDEGTGELPLEGGGHVVCTYESGAACGAFVIDDERPVSRLLYQWRPLADVGNTGPLSPPPAFILTDEATGEAWPTWQLTHDPGAFEACLAYEDTRRSCEGGEAPSGYPEACLASFDRTPCFHQPGVAQRHWECMRTRGTCTAEAWTVEATCPVICRDEAAD